MIVTSSFALGSFDFGLSDLISELTQVKCTHFTAKTKNNFICQNIEDKNMQYHWKVLFNIFFVRMPYFEMLLTTMRTNVESF